MKTKYILPLFTFLALQSAFAIAQDGSFDKLNFNQITKGSGATDYSGWGINLNPAIDVRPNFRQALIINHHDGLTFSSHSNYGGIRFYNQGYPIGPLEPSTGATMVMSINNNALGIGTTNPRVPLDVGIYASDKKLSAVLSRLPEGDGAGNGTFLGIQGHNTDVVDGKSFSIVHNFYGETNSSINFHRGGDITGGFISFNTFSNQERMRIDRNGNVGLGTTNPRAVLDISKYIPDGALGAVLGRLPEGDGTGNGTFLGIQGHNTNVVDGKSFSIVHNFHGETNSSINFHRGGDITGGFISFNTFSNQERMRIDRNGNVGIGTINPTDLLTVAGKIGAREIKVSTNAGADFVFEPNYKLPDLTELEKFVKNNKHLPEIPTAKEMVENGVSLGELNIKLLQKVEELTLYLIEKNRELSQEKEKNQSQEERITRLEKLLKIKR